MGWVDLAGPVLMLTVLITDRLLVHLAWVVLVVVLLVQWAVISRLARIADEAERRALEAERKLAVLRAGSRYYKQPGEVSASE